MSCDRPAKNLLVVFTMVPYPVRAHGVSVRYLPVIERLASRHAVDLVIIDGGSGHDSGVEALRERCRSVLLIDDPRFSNHRVTTKTATFLKFLLPWTPPTAFVVNGGRRVVRGLREAVGERHYDTLVWVGSYLSPYLLSVLPAISADRILVDFVDSPSLWAIRRKEKVFRAGPLERYEMWKTFRWEARIIRRVTEAIYISEVDAGTVSPSLTPGKRRHVIPNGVNVDSYTSARRPDISSPSLGFLGNMGYGPNVEAVEWLYREVFAPLRRERPGLSLVVIGRNPVRQVLDLGMREGVTVTGDVDDIWPYVNSVDVFVFPIWTGAGLKNKILEAMYAGRPVVTTAIGNEGIDAVAGRDIAICGTAMEFREEVLTLLGSPGAGTGMGRAARDYVRDRFSWDGILRRFEDLIAGGDGPLAGPDHTEPGTPWNSR